MLNRVITDKQILMGLVGSYMLDHDLLDPSYALHKMLMDRSLCFFEDTGQYPQNQDFKAWVSDFRKNREE